MCTFDKELLWWESDKQLLETFLHICIFSHLAALKGEQGNIMTIFIIIIISTITIIITNRDVSAVSVAK